MSFVGNMKGDGFQHYNVAITNFNFLTLNFHVVLKVLH